MALHFRQRFATAKGWGEKMMGEQKRISIAPIKNGSALDHLKPGTALKIISVLGNVGTSTTIAINVESRKMGRKDLIFITDKELSRGEINKIALIGKGGTLNTIRNSKIVKKEEIKYPDFVEGIIKCINPNCVTNVEKIPTKFSVNHKAALSAKCSYCETKIDEDEITRLVE